MFEGYFIRNNIIKGKFYFYNGAIFSGVIAENTQLVEGKYAYENWVYEGTFNDGKFHGKGIIQYQTTSGVICKYEGSFANSLFNGAGTLYTNLNEPEQQKIEGQWLQGIFQNNNDEESKTERSYITEEYS